MNLSDEQCQKSSKNLVEFYSADLNSQFATELKQFHTYIRARVDKDHPCSYSHQELYQIIVVDKIQAVFPNVAIALRIFLSMFITNCSAERSFSQLKRIKDPNRTTMKQERLDSLAILCIESDLVKQMTFDDIVSDFIFQKTRKKVF